MAVYYCVDCDQYIDDDWHHGEDVEGELICPACIEEHHSCPSCGEFKTGGGLCKPCHDELKAYYERGKQDDIKATGGKQ
jgi:hypothetical protein